MTENFKIPPYQIKNLVNLALATGIVIERRSKQFDWTPEQRAQCEKVEIDKLLELAKRMASGEFDQNSACPEKASED